MKIKITVDSTADLSEELLKKYNISVARLYIHFDEVEKIDGLNCSTEDIYKYVDETGFIPKTSAVSEGDYDKFFEEELKGYDGLIHFNLSSEMSVTHLNAVHAAERFPNVRVIDSKNLSTGTGLLALYAHDLVESGKSLDEIVKLVRAKVDKVRASFVLDKLTYLHKGGRCSTIKLISSSVLKIKPCIQVKDGKMSVAKKYVGGFEKVVMKYVDDQMITHPSIEPRRIFITYTKTNPKLVKSVRDYLESLHLFDEILETTAGCTITTHCGANTLGVLFIEK